MDSTDKVMDDLLKERATKEGYGKWTKPMRLVLNNTTDGADPVRMVASKNKMNKPVISESSGNDTL